MAPVARGNGNGPVEGKDVKLGCGCLVIAVLLLGLLGNCSHDEDGGAADGPAPVSQSPTSEASTASRESRGSLDVLDDSGTTRAGAAVEVDVVGNDTLTDGLAGSPKPVGDLAAYDFEVAVDTDPAHGTVEVRDGTVVYEPDAGFDGEDAFVYTLTVRDGGDESTGTAEVTITVEPGPTPTPEPAREDDTGDDSSTGSGGSSGVHHENRAAARAAGAAPVRIGEPGYGRHLDRDGDGIGCDS
ncbi:Ig-like domain-containing protein [Streptomyces macrosporus]|uniref:Excalibur calcium-binding domain-containing protein n=1 Tax=Streptomyces macrosporus TaxID=44032 RepID=A0ABN3KA25_9ACTN